MSKTFCRPTDPIFATRPPVHQLNKFVSHDYDNLFYDITSVLFALVMSSVLLRMIHNTIKDIFSRHAQLIKHIQFYFIADSAQHNNITYNIQHNKQVLVNKATNF